MSLITAQISGKNAGNVVQEAVEKALVELVRVRQMEVERLEVELAELRAHCATLFQSFSVPTFPSGYIPDPKRFEDAPELLQGLDQNDALTLNLKDDYMALEGSPDSPKESSPMLEIQKQTLALPRPNGKEVNVVDKGDEMPGEHLSRRRSARNLKEEARNKSVIDSITQLIQQTPKSRLDGTSAAAADEQTIMVRTNNSGDGTPSKFCEGAKDANNSEKEGMEARRSLKSSKLVVTSSPMCMYEAEFLDNADDISKEQFHRDSNARVSTHAGVPTTSSSPSVSPKGGKEIEWDDDNAVTILKEEIYRERRALKSPKKSPENSKNIPPSPGAIVSKNSQKKPEPMSSSSEKDLSSESEEPSSESDDSAPSSKSRSLNGARSKKSPHGKLVGPDSEEKAISSKSSSSSGSEVSSKHKPSPLKAKFEQKRLGSGVPDLTTTWHPKQSLLSSSSDSGESSSSSEDETVKKRWKSLGPSEGTGSGRARFATTSQAAAAASLSLDAPPEDRFDWTILGLQGPWIPSSSSQERALDVMESKDQSPLPDKFTSAAAYSSIFQKLIKEEAKAILLSEWEQYSVEQDPNNSIEGTGDRRGLTTQWHLRSMMQTPGDPFHYIEAEWAEGPQVKLDSGQLLCMVVPKSKEVKALAIVNFQDRSRVSLLRTRCAWDASLGQCLLLNLCNMVTLRRMHLAVSSISEIFSPLQQQLLDPMANIKYMIPPPALEEATDKYPNFKLKSETLQNFNNHKILNTMQLLTISGLLNLRQGFQLVQGPPGTGKTSTIVGMVSTLVIEEPGVKVLVCAPSNAALDEIAARLMHRMLDKAGNPYSAIEGAIVRFGSKRIMHPMVQSICLDSLSLRLASSSSRASPWIDILEGASIVCATLSGCGHTVFDELEHMFDVIIIDEAAQAVEPEVLIALKRVRGRCVMVGDPRQLSPTVFHWPGTLHLLIPAETPSLTPVNDHIGTIFGRSLFERLQEGGLPVYLLTTQYRMHPSISLYPSQQFYHGALQDSLRTRQMESIFKTELSERKMTINGCSFQLGHYCFMDVGWGIEREEMVGHSRANYEEALVVCNVVEGVVKGLLQGIKPNVGVITPYIAQRGVIEDQLESRGIDSTACEVNTVDGFQGREKDVIILSCVRAMADRGLGFVSDERRMNVALTRAKYSLILVGHAETLQKWSSAWGSLIDDARKRGFYQVLQNRNPASHKYKWNHRNIREKDASVVLHEEGAQKYCSTKKGKSSNAETSGVNKAVKGAAKVEDDIDEYKFTKKMKGLKRKTPPEMEQTDEVGDEQEFEHRRKKVRASKMKRVAKGDSREKPKSLTEGNAPKVKKKQVARKEPSVIGDKDEKFEHLSIKKGDVLDTIKFANGEVDKERVSGKHRSLKEDTYLKSKKPFSNKSAGEDMDRNGGVGVEQSISKREKIRSKGKKVDNGNAKLIGSEEKHKIPVELDDEQDLKHRSKFKRVKVEIQSRNDLDNEAPSYKRKKKMLRRDNDSPEVVAVRHKRVRKLPKETELTVREVVTTPLGGDHIRWNSLETVTSAKTQLPPQPTMGLAPRSGISWRNLRSQGDSMGWCPTVKAEVTEGTPEASRQPASAYTDHSLNDIGNHWGYENGIDYEMATRQRHWEKTPGRGGGRGSASNYQTPLIKKEDNGHALEFIKEEDNGHTLEVYSGALQTHDNNPDAYQTSRGWGHLGGRGQYQGNEQPRLSHWQKQNPSPRQSHSRSTTYRGKNYNPHYNTQRPKWRPPPQ